MTYAEKVNIYKKILSQCGKTAIPIRDISFEDMAEDSVYLVPNIIKERFRGIGGSPTLDVKRREGNQLWGVETAEEVAAYLNPSSCAYRYHIQNFYFISDECEPVGLEELI